VFRLGRTGLKHALRMLHCTCETNSRHHQAVQQIAPGFKVSATAPDGVIEAIERPKARFCLAIQWHPENFWRTGEFRSLFKGSSKPQPRSIPKSPANESCHMDY
jgi:gamma-glutamyl-gamma-aminobutyrate hydrolase PuuD